MILIVDSWAWLAILEENKQSEEVLGYLLDKQNKIITTTLNLYEVYYRLKEKRSVEEAIAFLATIKQIAKVSEIDEELAISAANSHLNEKLPAIDSFVYATANRYAGHVLTGDPHFKNKRDVIYLG